MCFTEIMENAITSKDQGVTTTGLERRCIQEKIQDELIGLSYVTVFEKHLQ